MMRDSKISQQWLRDMMLKNPPRVLDNGDLFSGIVRLAFVNLFERGKPNEDGVEGKFGAALLFPLAADLTVFSNAWHAKAREAFPRNFDENTGAPIGLHSPFHDQAEKTVGNKPYAGYTPGAIYMDCSSKFQPLVVDTSMNQIVDKTRAYPGVWAFCSLNTYHYKNKKTGVGFGLQQVMIVADDERLGGGQGNPKQAFGHVAVTAQTDIAARFNQGAAGILPNTGHVGHQGNLPVANPDDI